MPDQTTLLALFALLVSVGSLTLSAVSLLRDRSRVVAWSKIMWHQGGTFESPREVPVLHVFAMNDGRRPVSLLNLVKRNGKQLWWSGLQEPELSDRSLTDAHAFIEELQRNSVAHLSSIRLEEGEIFEKVLKTKDCPSFISLHGEKPQEASHLYVEDVRGKLYAVRDAKKHLKKLFDAWDPDADWPRADEKQSSF